MVKRRVFAEISNGEEGSGEFALGWVFVSSRFMELLSRSSETV